MSEVFLLFLLQIELMKMRLMMLFFNGFLSLSLFLSFLGRLIDGRGGKRSPKSCTASDNYPRGMVSLSCRRHRCSTRTYDSHSPRRVMEDVFQLLLLERRYYQAMVRFDPANTDLCHSLPLPLCLSFSLRLSLPLSLPASLPVPLYSRPLFLPLSASLSDRLSTLYPPFLASASLSLLLSLSAQNIWRWTKFSSVGVQRLALTPNCA